MIVVIYTYIHNIAYHYFSTRIICMLRTIAMLYCSTYILRPSILHSLLIPTYAGLFSDSEFFAAGHNYTALAVKKAPFIEGEVFFHSGLEKLVGDK